MKEPLKCPYGKKMKIYCDGGSRGNPGPAAFCILFLDEDDNELFRYKEFLGRKTNNQAELCAIKCALEQGVKSTRGEVEIYSDSENAINWLNGIYRVKSPNITPLFNEIQLLLSGTRYKKVTFYHVPRKNKWITICDNGVNICLDKNIS